MKFNQDNDKSNNISKIIINHLKTIIPMLLLFFGMLYIFTTIDHLIGTPETHQVLNFQGLGEMIVSFGAAYLVVEQLRNGANAEKEGILVNRASFRELKS